MSYMTLSSQDKHHFYSFHTFAHIRQHYFSKYWGTNAWAVPPPQTLGDRPPSPPRFPPLFMCIPCKVNKRTALFNIGLYVRVYLSLYLQEMVRLQCTDCRYPACMHSTLHSSIS